MKSPGNVFSSGVLGGIVSGLILGLVGSVLAVLGGGIPMFAMPPAEAAVMGFFYILLLFGIPVFLVGFVIGAGMAFVWPDPEYSPDSGSQSKKPAKPNSDEDWP